MPGPSRLVLPSSLTLTDGSVVLRDWRTEDAPRLAPVCGDADVCTFTSVPWDYTREAAEAWIERQRRKRVEGSVLALAITETADDEPVGTVNLVVSAGSGEASLGYWLIPDARGRGLASAAARLLCGWGFEHLGLGRIELEIRPDNVASQRVAERLGAVRDGLRPQIHEAEGLRWDMVVYSLWPGASAAPAPTGD